MQVFISKLTNAEVVFGQEEVCGVQPVLTVSPPLLLLSSSCCSYCPHGHHRLSASSGPAWQADWLLEKSAVITPASLRGAIEYLTASDKNGTASLWFTLLVV